MRTRTNARNRRITCFCAILMALLLLTGCLPDAGSTTNGRERFDELPTMEPAGGSEPTPTPVEEEPVQVPEFVTALLSPGSTLDPAERIFFRNGRDFWEFAGGEANMVLPAGTRFGPYATSPHGQRAAIVILGEVNGEQAETVHVVENGELGPPLTPERITSGRNAESSIVSVVWSRDATRLAIVYDDPQVDILEIAPADGSPPRIAAELQLPDAYRSIQRVDWAISGTALAILAEAPSGMGSLWIGSTAGELFEVVDAHRHGERSISDVTWLPGRGRIAFVEERIASSPATGGSMFSIAPDGSGRELLVSNGNFSPAAEITRVVASPDGSFVAFTVNVPNAEGVETFDSAWIVNIDSGQTSRVPVTPGFRVTDLWWTTSGLLWRGVHGPARDPALISTYAGVEPFILGLYNGETLESSIQFQSEAD